VASEDCDQIRVTWTNPALPEQIVDVNTNLPDNDPGNDNVPRTWSATYGAEEGITLSMLVNNFDCNSSNYSFEVSCVGQPACQIVTPETSRVTCKDDVITCAIQDVDLNCFEIDSNRRLRAETFVSGTDGVPITVQLTVTRAGGGPLQSAPVTDNDGGVSNSFEFDFQSGDYTVRAEITSPEECRTSREVQVTITDNDCSQSTDEGGGGGVVIPPDEETCPTCELCGGDLWCCLFWAFVFILLFISIATIIYLFCDPSGGGGWGWLILVIALILLALSIWWIVANCDFNLCTLLSVIVGAVTLDIALVCAIEGLFPCFSAVICGVIVIAGIQIRNWFIIMLIGLLVLFGINVFCTF
jgi:hypothetical protein